MINHDIPDLLEGFTLRACYADTDAAGVIHHARILEFFERSRTHWLYRIGAGPKQLDSMSLLLIIREVTLTFLQPGHLDDQLYFAHQITKRGNSQFALTQTLYRDFNPAAETLEEKQLQLLATAKFQIVCINTDSFKSNPLPAAIMSASLMNEDSIEGTP